jgi:hypothetical protein
MDYLKTAVKRLWGSKGSAATATLRERRVYLIYGVLATTYSFWLLGWVALRFGNHLVEQYQGPGFLAFSGLLMVTCWLSLPDTGDSRVTGAADQVRYVGTWFSYSASCWLRRVFANCGESSSARGS